MQAKSKAFVTLAALAILVACAQLSDTNSTVTQERTSVTDDLKAGFESPPNEARPRVWWHWMNGNVTKDGIEKDLDWMRRIGIGGLQHFDANLITPQIVDQRLVYMTPEWKDAFRFAARKADEYDLEMAIAASPGWSETGGPWVSATDGMKKIVWAQTMVTTGQRLTELPKPPEVAGPFQDMQIEHDFSTTLSGSTFEPPNHYEDIAVFAIPVSAGVSAGLAPKYALEEGPIPEAEILSDGKYAHALEVPRGTPEAPTAILVEFASPKAVSSATLALQNESTPTSGATLTPVLEARQAGSDWVRIARFDLTGAPTTVSFPSVVANKFRVVLIHEGNVLQNTSISPAPGADFGFLGDIVAAKPTVKVAELSLSEVPTIDRFEVKAGFDLVPDFYSLDTAVAGELEGVDPQKIIDLTPLLKPDASIDWIAPEGQWRILRMGWSLTGKSNHPATPEATGLEVDKYDAAAVRRYMEHYLNMYVQAAGEELIGKRGVQAVLTDSIEVGAANWTPKMLEHFKTRRGYDPTPYLPALTGVIIGSRAQSDGFLFDYRLTLSELMASEHYATVAEVAHEHDLKVYGEALETIRFAMGDDFDMRRYADIPMSAMWTYPEGANLQKAYQADMKGAASVANFYGKQFAAAESMTSVLNPWADVPENLKRVVDFELVNGINRLVIHTSVHQPTDDKQPGLSLFVFGQYFNRHETWAEMAGAWIDYISRASFLMQQGESVADVAYFYGEETPIIGLAIEDRLTGRPTRYGYDFVSANALLNDVRVEQGMLIAPSGARYRVLYLGGNSDKISLQMLERLAELVRNGATIVGLAPTGSPRFVDDPAIYQSIVKELWTGAVVNNVGAGKVIATHDVEQALEGLGVRPDFEYVATPSDADILFAHRKLVDGDIYFLTSRHAGEVSGDFRFRVSGKLPEIWQAETGETKPVSYRVVNGETIVPLSLAEADSVFLVFRETARSEQLVVPKVSYAPISEIRGPWTVSFQSGRGAPPTINLPELMSLSNHTNDGVKYFSGVSSYTNTIQLPDSFVSGQSVLLDLGAVGDLAEVEINGKAVGTLWRAPWQIEIGAELKPGDNSLTIKVANRWINRFIGDAQTDAEKITFVTIPTYTADAPLRDAGLLGPVKILAVQEEQ